MEKNHILLKDTIGEGNDSLINAIFKVASYFPWKNSYKDFPDPNMNTFTSWISKKVPELEIYLPFSAIGKNYFN